MAERTDLLVVGAGPTGLAAAVALKEMGAEQITVVDREPEPGGMPRLCHHTGFGIRDMRRAYSGPAYARKYVQRASAAGIDIRPSTTVTGWRGATVLAYTSPGGLGEIEARAVLLATGCRERPRAARLIPGSRPAGIFTTGSLQRFVYEQSLEVGKRAVVVGAELVSLSALLTLRHGGAAVVAMTTQHSRDQIPPLLRPVKWLVADLLSRTKLYPRTRVTRIFGQSRVEGIEITDLASGETRSLECDAVVFSGDWIPENELARLGGLQLDWRTRGPRVDQAFHTSVPGVFAAGNLLRGAETADYCAMEGGRAAKHIAAYLHGGRWPAGGLLLHSTLPIAWVAPGSVVANQVGPDGAHFRFRTDGFVSDAQLLVHQDGNLLHHARYRRLTPNLSAKFDAGWTKKVNWDGGEIQLTLCDSSGTPL